MTYAYGTVYKQGVFEHAAEIRGWNRSIGGSTGHLEGAAESLVETRRIHRSSLESFRRVMNDMRILGIISEDTHRSIMYVLAGMMIVNHFHMIQQLINAAMIRQLKQHIVAAIAEVAAMIAAQNYISIALALGALALVAATFGAGYYLGELQGKAMVANEVRNMPVRNVDKGYSTAADRREIEYELSGGGM